MARAVVFVHGTGVRGQAYAATLRLIRERLLQLAPDTAVSGCFWGDAEGVRPSVLAVPDHARTGGGQDWDAAAERSLWAVLYTDPEHELRLYAHLSQGSRPAVPPGRLTPGQELLAQVRKFTYPTAYLEDLDRLGLTAYAAKALTAWQNSAALRAAAEGAVSDLAVLRRLIARSLLAHLLVAADEDGAIPADGTSRDAMLLHLNTALRAEGRGVGRWSVHLVATVATAQARRHRGLLTDWTTPMAGDVLRYQAHGAGLRAMIRRHVEDTGADSVTLLGHSLGGIACLETLLEARLPAVDRLVTVGSQGAYLYEIGALRHAMPPDGLPGHFPEEWLNVHDPDDLLSYAARPVFGPVVRDVAVDNGSPFPQSHSAYWRNDAFWKVVRPWVV